MIAIGDLISNETGSIDHCAAAGVGVEQVGQQRAGAKQSGASCEKGSAGGALCD